MDDTKRRAEVDRIFTEALDLPQSERPAYLDQACGDDSELRAKIQRLLRGAEETDPFDTPLSPGGAQRGPLWDKLADLRDLTGRMVGERIGPYEILREIGRGGMGAVYLAKRADGLFRQNVALKLLKVDAESDEGLRRFELERQILATLNHPNIARLLDGGVAESGRPYFALEHIAGRPIDAYCDAHRLSVRERLRLFQTVGRAVQYAHRNLVVHRDLKPSNIFVDEHGDVKLLDFGIAKLLDSAAVLHGAPMTQTLQRLMTPEYASPEQVRGEPVTTATDVYQLGLVLYELLTGHKAYQAAELSPAELERVITARNPTAPSIIFKRPTTSDSDPGVTTEAISQARDTSPERLRRLLAGDLDTIVLVALDKEPTRRYATAAALVDDVENYLQGRPINAHRASLLYRTRKFVQRHRLGVTAALLLAVTLLGGILGIVWNAQRAEREASKAHEVKDFLISLFKESDPYTGAGGELTARQILDRGAERVTDELAEQPEVQTELMTVLGRVYVELGHYAEAQPLLESALGNATDIYGASTPEAAEALQGLAELDFYHGQLDSAVERFEQVLAVVEPNHGPNAAQTGKVLGDLGYVYLRQGRTQLGEDFLKRALTIAETQQDPTTMGRVLDHLASGYRDQGNYEEAETTLLRSIEVLERAFGPEHPDIGWRLNNLGALYHEWKRQEDATRLFARALAIFEKAFGPESPAVGQAASNLGGIYSRMGRLEEGERLLLRAVDIREKTLGPDSLAVAASLTNLGYVYLGQERLSEAEPLFTRATEIREKKLGSEHHAIAQSLGGLAKLRARQGRFKEAEEHFRRALELREKSLGSEHAEVAFSLQELASLYVDQGRYSEAEPLLQRALEVRRSAFGATSPLVSETRQLYDSLLAATGRQAASERGAAPD